MIFSAKKLALPLSCLLFSFIVINSCKHKPKVSTENDGGYPDEIAAILMNKCASCHNEANKLGSLRLDTWDQLFYGGGHGACVIPYDIENSTLLYYINTDPTLGPVATPTMPFDPNTANPPNPLSKAEYLTLRDWIQAGAPDKNGVIAFSSNPDTRQKFYLTEQGCDILSVIDVERGVVMRNIRTGIQSIIEPSHNVKVTKDGMTAYILTYTGLIQKIDTRTDQVIAAVSLPTDLGALWNVLHLSDDQTKLIATDIFGNRAMVLATSDFRTLQTISGLTSAHGVAVNASFDTFYIAAQYGNMVYKVVNGGIAARLSINGQLPVTTQPGKEDPHEMQMTPDGSKYFLTCQNTNKVRVMSTKTDKPVDSFDVDAMPQEMTMSYAPQTPYLFVSCMEQPMTDSLKRGSIIVINYKTMQVVTKLTGRFWQPHGVAVDDINHKLIVASRNVTNGPAPHHSSTCGGRNGWYNFYDINDLSKQPVRSYEVLKDPYSVDSRFKL